MTDTGTRPPTRFHGLSSAPFRRERGDRLEIDQSPSSVTLPLPRIDTCGSVISAAALGAIGEPRIDLALGDGEIGARSTRAPSDDCAEIMASLRREFYRLLRRHFGAALTAATIASATTVSQRRVTTFRYTSPGVLATSSVAPIRA